jgi:hypothetical protein
MNGQNPLERRYRRWLALYPSSFRVEHADEILDVLMQGADPDQAHPKAGEAASLAVHGLQRRVGRQFPGDWERAHAKVMFPTRIVIALWLCFISALLVGFNRGELWLILLIPAIVTHLFIAYKIRPSTGPRQPPRRFG